MKQRILLVCLAIFSLFSFYIFSGWVRAGKLARVSFDTTVRLQEKMPKRFDSQWDDLTFFGGPEMSVAIVLLLTAIAFIDVKKKKIVLASLLIPLFFFLLVSAEMYGKDRVESPAPPFFMLKNPTTIFPQFTVQEKYSYPSGHAARTLFFTFIAGGLMYRKTRKWKSTFAVIAFFSILTILISVAKVYLGHHWISDILGGYLLAVGMGLLFLSAYLPKINLPHVSLDFIGKLPISEFSKEKEEEQLVVKASKYKR